MNINLSLYQHLFNTMHVGVIVQDHNHNIIEANKSAQQLLGLKLCQKRDIFLSRNEFINKKGTVVNEESHPSIRAAKTGIAVKDVVLGLYHSEKNQPVWLLVNAYPEFNNGESPSQVCTTVVDITDQITAEKKFARKNEMEDLIVNISKKFIHASMDEVDDVIGTSLEELGDFSKADRLYIFDYDLNRLTTSNTYEWCASGIPSQIDNLQKIPLDDIPQWVNTHKKGEYLHVLNVSELEKSDPLRKLLEPQGIQSLITVPIMKQNRVVGFVGMDFVKKLYNPDLLDIDLLKLYSQILNNLYEHLDVLKKLSTINRDYKERLKELNTIYEVNNIVFKKPSIEEYFEFIVNKIPKGFLYPESTSVRVTYGENIFRSENFEKSDNKLESQIKINGNNVGRIEVLLNNKDFRFLNEERQLLESIARDSGIFLESNLNEQKIKESERRYRALFDNSPDGYLLLKDSIFIQCNKAAVELIGGNKSNIIGKSPADISPKYQPDGTDSQKFESEVLEKAKAGEKLSFNWIHKKADGQQICLEVHLNLIKIDSDDLILVTWRDRTVQVDLDSKIRKLSQAVEQSPLSIVITNLDGNIEYANKHTFKVTGYQPSELIGQNPRVLQSGQTPEENYDDLWDNLTKGKEWKGIFRNQKKNGDLYWESASIAPLYNEHGKKTHYIAVKEDITEFKSVQEKLAKNERRFSQIAEHSGNVVWELDEKGIYTYVNNVVEEIFGYKPEDLIGKVHFYELYPDDTNKQFKDLRNHDLVGQASVEGEERQIRRKNGSEITILRNMSPIYDEDNQVIGYRGSDLDISKRKKAEMELIKFKTISDEANYGAAISDLEGNLLYVNKHFAQMHGYEEHELLGKQIKVLHDSKDYPRLKELLDRIMNSGGFEAEEIPHRKKDGSTFDSLMNAKLITSTDGVPQFMSANVIDVTDLKEYQKEIQKLGLAIKQSPVAVIVTDLNGVIEFVNPAFTKITGWQEVEVIGKHTRILKSGKTPAMVYRDLWQTIKSGKTWEAQWTNKKKGGELYEEKISITPIENENGQIENYLAVKEDITNYKKHISTIEFQNNVLKNMAFTASHTVRAPLTRLMVLAELVHDDAVNKQIQKEFLKEILISADEIDIIIHKIADLLNEMELKLPNE